MKLKTFTFLFLSIITTKSIVFSSVEADFKELNLKKENPEGNWMLQGLSNFEEKQFAEASLAFHKAANSGYTNWRVYWYIAKSEYNRKNLKGAKQALKQVLRGAPDFQEAQEMLLKIEENE